MLRSNKGRRVSGSTLIPSDYYLPVERYYTPHEFNVLRLYDEEIGFKKVTYRPLVRTPFHVDVQFGLL